MPDAPLTLVLAPSNLGLRPLVPGHEPGTWRAPDALIAAGLQRALHPAMLVELARPHYSFEPEPDTRTLNGHGIRRFCAALERALEDVFSDRSFPVVLGGDCSILLGCLAAARRQTELALVHVDGHSDFRHPGNYDYTRAPGTAAGADLALATGRGETLLTDWGQEGPLVRDEDVTQIGERENRRPDFEWADMAETAITQMDVFWVREHGIDAVLDRTLERLARANLPFWLHVDLDVLDQAHLPAVDSPGSPGLDYEELSRLMRALLGTGRCTGADITIFDPEKDPDGAFAKRIVAMLADVFAG